MRRPALLRAVILPSLSSTGLAHRTEAGAGGRGCRKPAKMASKRPAPQESPGGGSATAPPPKKVHFEPFRIGQVSTLEDMDMKTLQFQNRKLAQRLEQRIRQENELRARVEQLEKRQTSDEGVLTVVNRYWNQLNEDLRVLLQRFDAEGGWEDEEAGEEPNEAEEATTSFLGMLLHWDREELGRKAGPACPGVNACPRQAAAGF
ncbi:hypothetical protein HPB48_026686 [Haemaphysalis longicornis]|uniref:E3 ubiquitin protein ligase n=1 Tax=Haemaphysalis longicornis TaxID=44386 RepID=A0A9J6HAF1_HAELO|nr:hypothetical protein HPB48_026686 [Haemaphysalis longicornis]